MDFMELMRDTTRFLSEAQYLTEKSQGAIKTHNIKEGRSLLCRWFHRPTYLVILKILRSLSALSTLIPNDMPGLKKPQTTSKMLPTMTCKTTNRKNIMSH